ncbi:DNA-directed RNA polymerase III subunit RPC3 [Sarcoptes scabiei]|nr:DNA-directed RNA polymerase III subunit RPC3 [Sarcoptes scabiei]
MFVVKFYEGLKCRLCKLNVHAGGCQENAPKCQPKPRLLRKQKSASELEIKIALPQIDDESKCLGNLFEFGNIFFFFLFSKCKHRKRVLI